MHGFFVCNNGEGCSALTYLPTAHGGLRHLSCARDFTVCKLLLAAASTNAFGVLIPNTFRCQKKRTPLWCSFFGSGRRIRTLTNRVRVCRATLTQSRYFELKKSWCRRRDLNPHGIATTTPSK